MLCRAGEHRGWCRKTVLRAAPCLFELYTAVALLHQTMPESKRSDRVDWPGKVGVTFSDGLTCVLRWLWREWVFHGRAGPGLWINSPSHFAKC